MSNLRRRSMMVMEVEDFGGSPASSRGGSRPGSPAQFRSPGSSRNTSGAASPQRTPQDIICDIERVRENLRQVRVRLEQRSPSSASTPARPRSSRRASPAASEYYTPGRSPPCPRHSSPAESEYFTPPQRARTPSSCPSSRRTICRMEELTLSCPRPRRRRAYTEPSGLQGNRQARSPSPLRVLTFDSPSPTSCAEDDEEVYVEDNDEVYEDRDVYEDEGCTTPVRRRVISRWVRPPTAQAQERGVPPSWARNPECQRFQPIQEEPKWQPTPAWARPPPPQPVQPSAARLEPPLLWQRRPEAPPLLSPRNPGLRALPNWALEPRFLQANYPRRRRRRRVRKRPSRHRNRCQSQSQQEPVITEEVCRPRARWFVTPEVTPVSPTTPGASILPSWARQPEPELHVCRGRRRWEENWEDSPPMSSMTRGLPALPAWARDGEVAPGSRPRRIWSRPTEEPPPMSPTDPELRALPVWARSSTQPTTCRPRRTWELDHRPRGDPDTTQKPQGMMALPGWARTRISEEIYEASRKLPQAGTPHRQFVPPWVRQPSSARPRPDTPYTRIPFPSLVEEQMIVSPSKSPRSRIPRYLQHIPQAFVLSPIPEGRSPRRLSLSSPGQ
uniref:Uncharacterized protein n=1 Tax=Graphocephala atropunctata TaxID=36148 RepID=A0A1B6M0C9_9HEMI